MEEKVSHKRQAVVNKLLLLELKRFLSLIVHIKDMKQVEHEMDFIVEAVHFIFP